jgi:hypothetical protein
VNDPRQNERLLTDVLSEGSSVDFREGLLNQTLRLARRRRHFRQARRAASALAVLVGLGLLVWRHVPTVLSPASLPAKPYMLVRTQPLPPAAWVATRPLSPANLLVSVRTGSIVITAKASVPVREINDDELLALVPKPAALVRHGPHSAELVFVSTVDRDELLRN